MGATTSSQDTQPDKDNQLTSSNLQYLLGDLTQVAPSAVKLYNLGKQCLTSLKNSPSGGQSVEPNVENLQEPKFQLFKPLQFSSPLYVGQTYVKWKSIRDIQNFYAFCAPVKTMIYVQPIDDFPDFINSFQFKTKSLELSLFELLQCFCQIYFSGLDAKVLPKISMQNSNWQIKSRYHSVTKEKQLYVADFFPYLQSILPSNGLCLLGITWTDLYPEDDLNFVLGESSLKYKSAMFCFGQYEPKGFNRETHKQLTEVDGCLVWKLLRVISHETCHLLGLQHCTFFHCAMNESNSVDEAISQPLFLCPVCLRKLQKCCGFNVVERYEAMLVLLEEINGQLPYEKLTLAIDWLRKCLQYLKE